MTRKSSTPIYSDTSPTKLTLSLSLSLSGATDCCAVHQAVGLSGPDSLCETLRREAVHQTAGPVVGHLRDLGAIFAINLRV